MRQHAGQFIESILCEIRHSQDCTVKLRHEFDAEQGKEPTQIDFSGRWYPISQCNAALMSPSEWLDIDEGLHELGYETKREVVDYAGYDEPFECLWLKWK